MYTIGGLVLVNKDKDINFLVCLSVQLIAIYVFDDIVCGVISCLMLLVYSSLVDIFVYDNFEWYNLLANILGILIGILIFIL